ncbi:hypothetical protein ADL30_35635 [Streptomyces sp. NRRL S-1521]|nr:hypothetical protein ADL30_35635 [Streptomyces sp. NRRL S-1521]
MCRRNSSALGRAARCTDPSRHHDQTSSVTNGGTGAKSRSRTSSAVRGAARADSMAAAPPWSPYALALTGST